MQLASLVAQVIKASVCNAGDMGSIPGSGRSPGEGNWQPTPVLLPEKFHGWRSLIGYSPWGHREPETTERLHFHFERGEEILQTENSTDLLQTKGETNVLGWWSGTRVKCLPCLSHGPLVSLSRPWSLTSGSTALA